MLCLHLLQLPIYPAPASSRADFQLFHYTQDCLAIDPHSFLRTQPQSDPPIAIRAMRALEGFLQQGHPLVIRVSSLAALSPGIECGSRNSEQGTHLLHGVSFPVSGDERLGLSFWVSRMVSAKGELGRHLSIALIVNRQGGEGGWLFSYT